MDVIKRMISGCTININRHLKKDSRLILHPDSSSTDGYRFVLPSAGHSLLTFQQGQEVVFACPNGVYERAQCNTGKRKLHLVVTYLVSCLQKCDPFGDGTRLCKSLDIIHSPAFI
jgi:hypothetical protein